MLAKIVVLGTHHGFQRGTIQKEEFTAYIEDLVKAHDIKIIGDEIDQRPNTKPVAKEVAELAEIQYQIIEPKPDELKQQGIESYDDIYNYFITKYDLGSSFTREDLNPTQKVEYENRIQDMLRQREAIWLAKLQQLNVWPALVICGSFHYEAFCNLLTSEGYRVVKENSYWGKEHIASITTQPESPLIC